MCRTARPGRNASEFTMVPPTLCAADPGRTGRETYPAGGAAAGPARFRADADPFRPRGLRAESGAAPNTGSSGRLQLERGAPDRLDLVQAREKGVRQRGIVGAPALLAQVGHGLV